MSDPVQEAIRAATSVARDLAEGRLKPEDLDKQAVEDCRRLFGNPAQPSDPLWPLHGEVCRMHLAAGGVDADELQQWLGVVRHRQSVDGASATDT